MFVSTRRWLRKNKTPIAIGVGVVGAGYVLAQYVVSKLNAARDRMSSDRIAKENLRRRFEQNQEDCTFTVLALLPTATHNILEAMNTERITYEIQQLKTTSKGPKAFGGAAVAPSIADTTLTEDDGKSSSLQSESGVHASRVVDLSTTETDLSLASLPESNATSVRKTKRQLWDDLTISAITRTFTLIYTLALLTMLTRVQLNLLGRRSYLSSVVALATGVQQSTISLENNDDDNTEQEYGNDFDTNRKYLTFSWWLLNKGWVDIMHRVEEAVKTVFGPLSPRDLVSFQRFSELTLEVRKLIEGATVEERRKADWLRFLLPPVDQEEQVVKESGILEDNAASTSQQQPALLRRLLDETADLIESPSFSHVLTLLLDAGFSALVDVELGREAFGFKAPEGNGQRQDEDARHTKVVLLPKILSVLTRQAHVVGNGVPNAYLQEMEKVRDLEAFAAVVYSNNWENEMRSEGIMDSAVYVKPEDALPQPPLPPPPPPPRPSFLSSSRTAAGSDQSSMVVVGDAEADFQGAWNRAIEQRR